MSKNEPRTLDQIRPIEQVDEFLVVERVFSEEPGLLSIGLANIHAEVPNIEANKEKILRACQIFKERGVNIAIFPEFCLSGYFWEDEDACWEYMNEAVTENHRDWIEGTLKSILDDQFPLIIMNNITHGPARKFFNTTFFVSMRDFDYLDPKITYNKVFLPGIEKIYTETGRDDRLMVESSHGFGRFGFTTCYDYLFNDLLREYSMGDNVDVIVQLASWRAASLRDYPGMNVRTDLYYGDLWNMVMAASSATNQVWTIACNAVGRHAISGAAFWGGSGVWAPSGMKLLQASHFNEELLIVHNLDIQGERQIELEDFDYGLDFRDIYKPMDSGYVFTRKVD
jgi:predicted amidohydrolase